MDDMQEILEEFFVEAEESLDEIEQDLIKLEAISEGGEWDSNVIDRLFRGVHTLKGGAGFLGLDKMAKLAHAGENLMDEVRSEKVAVDKGVMDALLQTNDYLKDLMEANRSGDGEDSIDITGLVETLEKLAGAEVGVAMESPAAPEVAEPVAEEPVEQEAVSEETPSVEVNQDLLNEVMGDDRLAGGVEGAEDEKVEAAAAPAEAPAVEVNQDLLNEVMGDDRLAGGVEGDDEGEVKTTEASPAPAATEETPSVEVNQDLLNEVMGDDRLAGGVEEEAPQAAPVVAAESVEVKRGEKPVERRQEDRRDDNDDRRKPKPGRRKEERKETNIRVETTRLDSVMNLVGELVLARNSLMQQLNSPKVREVLSDMDSDGRISESSEILSRVTQDLQMSVLGIRMQPIKKVFDKIPRQVRELKNSLGREVELIIEGEDTEIDKTLVEELADPMVHLIRNAMDHGIETPEDRMAKDKDPQATLAIRALYEGNNIVIEIEEDGAGIDPEKIKSLALKKGVISQSEYETISDRDAIRLIFAPGFSTAEQISSVSGRGVGMDVVHSKITAVKGRIDVDSTLGKGTKVSIYLPLTLAIMDALVVGVQEEGFAIPIADISEVIKFNKKAIHKVNDKDVIELRGEVLPLYYLANLTEKGISIPEGEESPEGSFVVVVREGTASVGIVIDELLGQEEAVVKPVTEMFKFDKAVSGATIMGDGMVHMILDVPVLMKEEALR